MSLVGGELFLDPDELRGQRIGTYLMNEIVTWAQQWPEAPVRQQAEKIAITTYSGLFNTIHSTMLRRRVHAGLNKGEARNALATAVFFNRLGEIRDRSFEQQRYRASGLNLITAAIVLWNTVYLQRAVAALREQGRPVNDDLLRYLSPLGWEHINLTGDYVWRRNARVGAGKFRPLRPLAEA